MKEIVIIIPAYQPQKDIMQEFINKLKLNFENILIIDDGSGKEYKDFFTSLEKQGVNVIKHYANLGKGRAIKTAFNYCLNTYPDMIGCVTADCDGQHTVEDIKKCALKLKEEPESLVLGTRDFDKENVPFKSRYGNKITRNIFKTFIGIKITDTQTGLRAFGKKSMQDFLNVSGERFEYETNMLIECKEKNIKIAEVPIETVYINNNETSHFHPVRDAILIYKLFLKYILSALSSFIVDILLFTLFINILPEIKWGVVTTIVLATIIARIFSSTYNFTINAQVVFKNKTKSSIIKYFTLVIVQMFISAFVVSFICRVLNANATFIKVIIDTVIFIVNFIIQREWVFKK